MMLSPAEIKRQILMEAKNSPFKKRYENPPGIPEGEMIEWGNELERTTQTKGWTWIESFMLRRMNLVGLAMNDKEDPNQKGIAKGYIELMQAIQLAIEKKNEILEKEKQIHSKKEQGEDNEV